MEELLNKDLFYRPYIGKLEDIIKEDEKIDDYNDINQMFSMLGFSVPDLVFDFCLFDGGEVPLVEKRDINGNQRLSGVYAFLNLSTSIDIVYVGKAIRLKNRLKAHFEGRSDICVNSWMLEDDFCPFVAVWFTDDREKLESDMIRKIKPKYNIMID